MMNHITIRSAKASDAYKIAEIYKYYVENTDITFDILPPNAHDKQIQMQAIMAKGPYLVAEYQNSVIGYAYAKPWQSMAAYRHTYESTIYLAHDRQLDACKGLGKKLYQQLIKQLKQDDHVHILLAVPTTGNIASERLHLSLGFKKVAQFHEVGRKFNRWLNIDYYMLQLN